MMTMLPIIGTGRVYGLFGLGTEHGVAFRTRPEDERVGNLIYMLVLYQLCFAFALATRIFFEDADSNEWADVAVVVLAALVLSLGSYISYRHPWKCVGLVAVAMIALGWAALVFSGWVFFARSVWFYLCALGTVWFRNYTGEPEKLKKVRFEIFVGLPFSLLLFFSTAIYGNAKPKFGGGAPIQVLLHLSTDLSKVFGSETMAAWLVEQTDDAIYILRARSGWEAILVPRSQIRAIEFNYTPAKKTAK